MPKRRKGRYNEGKTGDKRLLSLIGVLASILGVATGLLSFFPHLAVSNPIQMSKNDFFSYQMTITNDGILPVFDVRWALAPRVITVRAGSGGITSNLKSNGILIFPGATFDGPADYSSDIRKVNSDIGMLDPGDGDTFTTEYMIAAPAGSAYGDVDFAIAITYIPIFPPIPMQTCSRFRLYRDRKGNEYWFRAPSRCNRFPWLHHWFDHSSSSKRPPK